MMSHFYISRFFFMVEEGDTPVSMTITPCASAIDWRLTLQDLPEGLSGDGTGKLLEEYII